MLPIQLLFPLYYFVFRHQLLLILLNSFLKEVVSYLGGKKFVFPLVYPKGTLRLQRIVTGLYPEPAEFSKFTYSLHV
jgi:hypothetical protein